MIIFFGPAGAGKSVQAQILAARQGWRWLSIGQLLRDTRDPEVLDAQQKGVLVPFDRVNQVMGDALDRARDANVNNVILDGYPRNIDQTKWLVENCSSHDSPIDLVIVLEVPKSELMKRLELRGRVDDELESIDERLLIYRQEIYPILNYITEKSINIVHIDGAGTVGQVHDKIMEELETCKLL